MPALPESHEQAAGQVSRYLARYGSPRFHLFLILVATTAVGALASVALLLLGLTQMWLRYPIAATIAYAVFLALLRMWANHQLAHPDLISRIENAPAQPKETVSESWSWVRLLDGIDLGMALDEAPGLLVVIVAVLILLALLFVIVIAPLLLAEVLLDALLVAGLWRRVKNRAPGQPDAGVLRLTIAPALLVILGLGVIGFALQSYDPSADSIGDVFRPSRSEPASSG